MECEVGTSVLPAELLLILISHAAPSSEDSFAPCAVLVDRVRPWCSSLRPWSGVT